MPRSACGGLRLTRQDRPDTAELVRERLAKDANDPDALFTLAALRAKDGKVEEGLTILDRVLRIDPNYPGAWVFKATLLRMRERREGVEETPEGTEE